MLLGVTVVIINQLTERHAREVVNSPSFATVKALLVDVGASARKVRCLGRWTVPVVVGDVRIYADGSRRGDGTSARITDHTIERGWSLAVLDPLDELTERILRNRPWCE